MFPLAVFSAILFSFLVMPLQSLFPFYLSFFSVNHPGTAVTDLSLTLCFHAPFVATVWYVFGGNQINFLHVPSPATPSAFDLLESFLIFVMRIYLPLLNWRSLLGCASSLWYVWDVDWRKKIFVVVFCCIFFLCWSSVEAFEAYLNGVVGAWTKTYQAMGRLTIFLGEEHRPARESLQCCECWRG